MRLKEIHIDGSCNNNPKGALHKVGGVGVIYVYDTHIQADSYGKFRGVTSARMEVMGLYLVSREIVQPKEEVEIFCDNQYVVNAIAKGWLWNWIGDYRNSGIERPNIDLWDTIYDNVLRLRKVECNLLLNWNKGHAGNKYNELADQYADIGRKKGRISKILNH